MAQSKPPTNQATIKQPTNNTINLCTNHPTHHTHQPALHPDGHTSYTAPAQYPESDPRSSKAKAHNRIVKKNKKKTDRTSHCTRPCEQTLDHHGIACKYAAQASRRIQPKGLHVPSDIYMHVYEYVRCPRVWLLHGHLPCMTAGWLQQMMSMEVVGGWIRCSTSLL